MAEPFTLALAQAEATRYDKQANLAKAAQMVAEAADRGARAIVFPEMFLTGYTVWDRVAELAEPLDGSSVRALAEVARRHGIVLACGFPEASPDGGPPLNSVCLIESDGTILGSYHKIHLFSEEPRAFNPGGDFPVFDTSLGRVGLLICYDVEFPEAPRLLTLRGAKLLLASSANMEPYAPYQSVFVRARAMENGVYVALANTVGDDGSYIYVGESIVADPEGQVLCHGGSKEEMLFAEINLDRVPPEDVNVHYLGRRRPEMYGELAGPDVQG
jgi:predicted amidohydrolase